MNTSEQGIDEAIDGATEFVTRYKYEQITPAKIFEESGYSLYRSQITEENIETRLKETPFLVDDWLAFSSDQRNTPSWFITEKGNIWEIGYIKPDGSISDLSKFSNRFEACAHFIKAFMEHMEAING